jgi:tRNA A-37 threonylcarbamoyl transferase component Bud32
LALVVNALTNDELSGGKADTARVYSLLCDEELGDCDLESPPPLRDCESRSQFQDALINLIRSWDHNDQLILYFSGHGCVRNGKYTIIFGTKPHETYLPFDSITSDLQTYGVSRAIVILDACQSGAALRRGQKDLRPPEPTLSRDLPQGVAVLASCREYESSYELDDGSGSVFTHLLYKGIKTGLGGRATIDALIGPEDIVEFINQRLREDQYSTYAQSSVFGVYAADRQVWLARNKTKAEETPGSKSDLGMRSLDELRILYEKTETSRWPCPGPTVEDLDPELLRKFAESTSSRVALDLGTREIAERVGLYSTLAPDALHKAAVLCFANEPHTFIPQARATFLVGSRTTQVFRREDVLGPLSQQVSALVERIEREVVRAHRKTAFNEQQKLFFRVIREAVSNAITHRDYDSAQVVRVSVDFPHVEIVSPGSLPGGLTFENLLRSDHLSQPKDAAIAWYLTTLLAFEGVGRGFAIFEAFVDVAEDKLEWDEDRARSFVRIKVTFPTDQGTLSSEEPAEERDATIDLRSSASQVPAVDQPTMGQTAADHQIPAAWGDPARLPLEKLGAYKVISIIGAGATGPVYLAVDERLDRRVAVKILSQRFEGTEARSRFREEARIAARLSHPNIVPVYDTGTVDDFVYLVMEYIEGSSLRKYLDEHPKDELGPEYFRWVATIVREVASALGHAHQNSIIHRDVKPGNILLDAKGSAHVSDFGISRDLRLRDSDITVTGAIVGTPAYMSPEQLAGDRLDPRSDIYSLGVVFFEMLTREKPRTARFIDPTSVQKALDTRKVQIPVDLRRVCTRALQLQLDQRYSEAEEMVADLDRYLGGRHRGNFFRRWLDSFRR